MSRPRVVASSARRLGSVLIATIVRDTWIPGRCLAHRMPGDIESGAMILPSPTAGVPRPAMGAVASSETCRRPAPRLLRELVLTRAARELGHPGERLEVAGA